ncbi:MAG: DUF4412 domain-containing protein [Bacteroidia bacterium]|jgi:hypothetical protein|nr:DUF4412 domain-containing protein [Bacteroidia bacterium]
MKHLLFGLVILILNMTTGYAQESYTIKMTLKIEGLPPEYAAFGEQDMVNYMKGDLYKNETSSMMGSSSTCFDGKILTSISEQMDTKTGYTATKEELEAAKAKEGQEKPKIEYTNETKKIAGYECTKAIMTSVSADGKENKVTVWVTEKIKSSAAKGRRSGGRGMQMDFGDLKGYPLQIETSQNQNGNEMKVTITAIEVSTSPLEDSFFTINTEGYTMMSYQQMMENMKKMRRGGE